MTRSVVITRYLAISLRVVTIVHMVVILAVVAVSVVGDVRVNIRLIMTQIHRSRSVVVMRIIVPVVRRTPRVVTRTPPVREHRRSTYKHRANVVVGAIDERSTDNLNIRRSVTHLCCQCCHVLENVLCQYSLNNNHVVITLYNLHNTQIVNISVAV